MAIETKGRRRVAAIAVAAAASLPFLLAKRRVAPSAQSVSIRSVTLDENAVACEPWQVRPGIQGFAWRAPDARAVLLLQHGYGEYSERYIDDYSGLIPSLLAAGISVYAFDLAGHGRSAGPRVQTDIAQAVEDHLSVRRCLADQSLPVFVLGHSLGGLVTAASVARDGDGLAGAIIMSAALLYNVPRSILRGLRAVAGVAPSLPAPIKAGPFDKLYRGVDRRPFLAGRPMFYTGRMSLLLASSGGEVAADAWSLYPAWSVPTLIVHGTEDAYTDITGSRRLHDRIASPDKTLSIVSGGYHELLNDTDGSEVLSDLLAWIEARIPHAGQRPPTASV